MRPPRGRCDKIVSGVLPSPAPVLYSFIMKVLIIIRAYNEEASLERTVEGLRSALSKLDFIIINDGSRDSTAAICRKKHYPFIDLPVNLGLSGAFQTGIKYASLHRYDCAVQFDADGQHRPEYIPFLLRALDGCDIVIGSRFVADKKPKSLRMLGSSLITAAIRATTGKTIHDPTSGMRAYNARMIDCMARTPNLSAEPDTLSLLMKRADARVVEVPVTMNERTAGKSYFNVWSSCVYMLSMAVSILFMQFFRKSPLEDTT